MTFFSAPRSKTTLCIENNSDVLCTLSLKPDTKILCFSCICKQHKRRHHHLTVPVQCSLWEYQKKSTKQPFPLILSATQNTPGADVAQSQWYIPNRPEDLSQNTLRGTPLKHILMAQLNYGASEQILMNLKIDLKSLRFIFRQLGQLSAF